MADAVSCGKVSYGTELGSMASSMARPRGPTFQNIIDETTDQSRVSATVRNAMLYVPRHGPL